MFTGIPSTKPTKQLAFHELLFFLFPVHFPCIFRITSPELPPMAVQYTSHVIQTETHDNDTALPLVEVLVT